MPFIKDISVIAHSEATDEAARGWTVSKKKRRARRVPACARCAVPADTTPAGLLGAVADALNACETAGISISLKHGAVYTRHGYVLPIADGWAARTLLYTEFTPPEGDELDD